MYPHNKYAPVDPGAPTAQAVCERCGFIWHHHDLDFQYDFRGSSKLTNTKKLVCPRCMDDPQPQNQPKDTPADPVPIKNPRPAPWSAQEGPPPADVPVYLLIPDHD